MEGKLNDETRKVGQHKRLLHEAYGKEVELTSKVDQAVAQVDDLNSKAALQEDWAWLKENFDMANTELVKVSDELAEAREMEAGTRAELEQTRARLELAVTELEASRASRAQVDALKVRDTSKTTS